MPRTRKPTDPDLLLRVARLKGVDGLNNGQIAETLQIDPREVRVLVRESTKWILAKLERLAELERANATEIQLERRLIKKFPHLKKVLIVPSVPDQSEAEYGKLAKRLAAAGAKYLDDLIDEAAKEGRELHIGVSGGETILEVVNSLQERTRLNAHFYATAYIGRAFVQHSSHVDPAVNAAVAWARSGRLADHCHYATVSPFYLSKRETMTLKEKRDEIAVQLNDLTQSLPSIRNHLKASAEAINVAVAGLGVVVPPKGARGLFNRLTGAKLLSSTTRITPEEIAREGAIADFSYCFYDSEGNGNNEKWRFFLTAGDQDPERRGVLFYRKMVEDGQLVITIEGDYKVPAIRAALKGKFFNVWITDEQAARAILAAK